MKKLASICLMSLAVSCVQHDLDNLGKPIDCSTLQLTLGNVVKATSCSTADGSIEVVASGGEEPYTFLLNEEEQSSGKFTNLRAGIYSIGLLDANQCDTVLTNIQVLAEGVSFTATIEDDTECLSNNGTITISVDDGNPPHLYRIDGGVYSPDNFFTGLASGVHTVAVKNGQDCALQFNITVPRGFTGTSWSNDIKPLMVTYCAITNCHNGVSREDLRQYDIAKQFADKIRSTTQDRSMPRNPPSLTQQQIDVIACWVDDGALNN
jgi:hypothetical protein